MFNNWINFHELFYLVKKYQQNPEIIQNVLSLLLPGSSKRVESAWSHTQAPPHNWWDVPTIRTRWNYLVSGENQVDYREYLKKKYFTRDEPMRAISLACGNGSKEFRWAETKKFHQIDAYDISENRIRHAIDLASKNGLSHIINFQVGDIHKLDLPGNYYDVVFGEGSLHHFSPLRTILERIHQSLKPDGYFIVNDYVGPTRFQWTEKQLEMTNALLAMLPPQYKTLWNSNSIKNKVFRPGKSMMVLKDPSEAIESFKIRPLLNEIFDVVEIKGYGGTILHPLFSGIAHHFITPDEIGQNFMQICCAVEDFLLSTGDLRDDFIVAVCKKRNQNPSQE